MNPCRSGHVLSSAHADVAGLQGSRHPLLASPHRQHVAVAYTLSNNDAVLPEQAPARAWGMWGPTSGDSTVEMVGLKEMADWKRLKMMRAASYSVFSTSSAR